MTDSPDTIDDLAHVLRNNVVGLRHDLADAGQKIAKAEVALDLYEKAWRRCPYAGKDGSICRALAQTNAPRSSED